MTDQKIKEFRKFWLVDMATEEYLIFIDKTKVQSIEYANSEHANRSNRNVKLTASNIHTKDENMKRHWIQKITVEKLINP